MSSIILPKHTECVINEAPKEGCYLMSNNDTGWCAGLCVDFEKKVYNIIVIFDNDTLSLGYFREFLNEEGWIEE